MTLNEIRERRADLIKQARDLDAKAKAESRSLSETEVAQVDGFLAEFDKLEADEQRAAKLESAEQRLSSVSERRSQPLDTKKTPASNPEDRELEDYRAFLRGEVRDVSLGTNSAGGFMVTPTKVADEIINIRREENFMRAKGTEHRLSEAISFRIPRVSTDVTGGYGTETGTTSADSSLAFAGPEVTPQRHSYLVKVSTQTLKVQPRVENVINGLIAGKASVTDLQKALVGSGTAGNEPLGLFYASNDGIPTTRDVSATTAGSTTLDADKLIDGVHTLKPAYRQNAEWVINHAHLGRVRKLKDSNGQYLWAEGLGGNPSTLLGYPVNETEFAPGTYSSGQYFAVLGDISQYHWVDVDSIDMSRLDQPYRTTGQVGILAEMFSNGLPADPNAFVRFKIGD